MTSFNWFDKNLKIDNTEHDSKIGHVSGTEEAWHQTSLTFLKELYNHDVCISSLIYLAMFLQKFILTKLVEMQEFALLCECVCACVHACMCTHT